MRTLVLFCLSLFIAGSSLADAAELKPEGKWKLLVQTYDDHGFLVVNVTRQDDKLAGEILASQRFLGGPEVKAVSVDKDTIKLTFDTNGTEYWFEGKLADQGDHAGKVLGVFRFQGGYHPAQLVTTEDDEVGGLTRGPITTAVGALRRSEPKERVAELKDLIKKHQGSVTLFHAYGTILKSAEAAELSAADVRKLWDDWKTLAEPYGPRWTAESREYAVAALRGQKPYAELTIELVQSAEQALPEDASTESRASLAGALAEAAKLAGNEALAKQAGARAEGFEKKLDEEYIAKVPPFKPAKFARENKDNNRVVLVELFTGSECPPCVAADVAFDGLLKTYQPSDVVLLQYHLHIPRPDPLTNEDADKRSAYYALRGTPSTYLNGMNDAPGGGGLAASEAKYDQYRQAIEPKLEGKKRASIDLNLKRDGQKITIRANARANADEEQGKPMLRLALAEKTIRFPGGNAVRFHHHVVRSMPGGVDGKALEDGKAAVEVTVDLNDLKASLTKYLEDFEKERSFPSTKPPIDLQNLSVVAFVQDDDDKGVWHAVTQNVP